MRISGKLLAAMGVLGSLGIQGQTVGSHDARGGGPYRGVRATGTASPRADAKAPSRTQQPRTGGTSVTLLGSAPTASSAESFALNGNLAYVCDDNEVSVLDISNPQNPQVLGTALSGLIQASTIIHCAVQSNALVVFADQSSTLQSGPGPGVSTFSLTNPLVPQLIHATALNKRFFGEPVYAGSFAFIPTNSLDFFLKIQWDQQFGDLVSVNLANLSNPVLQGTLEQPQADPTYGGLGVVRGATIAGPSLVYVGGSSSTGGANNGLGRLQVADVTVPSAMKIVAQLLVPSTILLNAPLIEGTVGVSLGNNGGYVGSLTASPGEKGNITITTFDVSDMRSPVILTTVTTAYSPGLGQGATQIGDYLFAFAGVQDASANQVLLIVDVSNPSAPVIQSIPLPQPFTSMQAVGTTLYATVGSGGFKTYSIPGITTGSPSVCPVAIDAMLVVDRGAQVSGAAFQDAKTALKTFVDALHLTADQAGLVSFANSAQVSQTLTVNGAQEKAAVDAVTLGGISYIGAGIDAARGELTGPRHSPGAIPLIILLSDGGDAAAPNNGATLAAANTAKAAGIRIISVQYGTSATTVMSSIASAMTDFYQVTQ